MTRQQLEARRLANLPEIDSKTSAGQLARKLKVSRTTIYRWRNARARGESLQARIASGRPRRMSAAQERQAILLFRAGPRIVLETDRDRWTQHSFAAALKQEMGLEYSHDHAGRVMHRLKLIPIRKRGNHGTR